MQNDAEAQQVQFLQLTADIVAAYVQKNAIPAARLPELIASVNSAFSGLIQPVEVPPPALVPAVNPKRSVFPDYIVCLEDGKKFKSLKRHLNVHFGLSPDEYRSKWGLSRDYPMVAPNYAAQRSVLARSLGLGRKAAVKAAPIKPVAKTKKPAARRKTA
ncbi:MucR family transcriptional regulator [Mesorhizobium sp. ORM6]